MIVKNNFLFRKLSSCVCCLFLNFVAFFLPIVASSPNSYSKIKRWFQGEISEYRNKNKISKIKTWFQVEISECRNKIKYSKN